MPPTIPLHVNRPLPLTIADAPPGDPALRAIAFDVLNRLKYAFAANAAQAALPTPGRADAVFQRFLATRSASSRAAFRHRAGAFLQAPLPVREATFGRYGKLALDQYAQAGSDRLTPLVGDLQVDPQRVRTALEQAKANPAVFFKLPPDLFKQTEEKKPKIVIDKDLVDGAKFKRLRLFIKTVHCIEETDEIGSDEINMGGTAVSADGAKTELIPQFKVSHDFDEDEVVDFGLGKLFAVWNLQTNIGWPAVYPVSIAMAEKDDGGFGKFLQDLWDLVGEEVKEAVAGLAGAAIGAALGAGFGGVGAIVGAIIGFTVGALIEWLLGLADNPDDIVGVKTFYLSLGAATASYYAWTGLTKAQPPTFSLDWHGDGGRYRTWCYYKITP